MIRFIPNSLLYLYTIVMVFEYNNNNKEWLMDGKEYVKNLQLLDGGTNEM